MTQTYSQPTPQNLSHLKSFLEESQVLERGPRTQGYGTDWTGLRGNPWVVLLPKTTLEVQKILGYATEYRLKVVPNGGRTGLTGAAFAAEDELVLAFDKMNQIIGVDHIGLTMQVEAGVILETIQKKALAEDLYYGVDLAAKGSCQIGGNIATNAGGLKLIRFGGTREQVLGLEIVLANGEILDLDRSLVKNNSGYDLKQLFIGSEGTLGIITKATLKLSHKPKDLRVLCLGLRSLQHILRVLRALNLADFRPSAFEFFTQEAMSVVLSTHQGLKNPFSDNYAYYALIEAESKGGDGCPLEDFFEKLLEDQACEDGTISHSISEYHGLWKLRELISESVAASGHVRKNDIALPINQLALFVEDLESVLKYTDSALRMVLFGHIGDGNLHLNYLGQRELEKADFHQRARVVEEKVFALTQKYRGSISAEHGIGLTKKDDLKYTRSKKEISLMKEMKSIFDPLGILNPGKIFDLS